MPKHTDPQSQQTWENLYKLIRMCPDPPGWGLREKLEADALAYGKAMYDYGRTIGWNTRDAEDFGDDD